MSDHLDRIYTDIKELLFGYQGEAFEFSISTQQLPAMSNFRKIRALCYLFDVMLESQIKVWNTLKSEDDPEMDKEQAFASLQMALTFSHLENDMESNDD